VLPQPPIRRPQTPLDSTAAAEPPVATADAAPAAGPPVVLPVATPPRPPAQPRSRGPVASQRRSWGPRIPEPLLLLIVIVVALGLAVLADHRLRRLQNVAELISRREQPVFVPFSDTLEDRLTLKFQWNQLLAERAAALSNGNMPAVATKTYALDDFAISHPEAGQASRFPLLLDLIGRDGNDPAAVRAYEELLNPVFHRQTLPNHPAYVQKLLDIAAAESDGGIDMLAGLGSILQTNNEPALALKVLKQIRSVAPVDFQTEAPMRQLLAMLGPSDPDAAPLFSALAALDAQRMQMGHNVEWYSKFAAAGGKASLSKLEGIRGQVPATPLNAFTASADAQLIDRYLRDGRFDDATKVRERFVDYSGSDMDSATVFAQNFTPPDDAAHPRSARKTAALKAAIVPDSLSVKLERWRSLLLAKREADANALAAQLFAGPMSYLAKPAADLTDAEMGRVSKLSPVLVMNPPQGDVPPEMQGAEGVLTASLDLSPNTGGSVGSIHTHVELWLSRDSFLQIVQADEPRVPLPKPVVTKHDVDPWHDEYVDFYTSPDCWVNFANHWAVTSAGTTWDAREEIALNPDRSKRRTDKSLELGVKVQAAPTATGWSLRILVPRKLIIPPGPTIVRFNSRRGRHDMHADRLINQYYTWAPIPGVDPRLDLMGWLVVPQ
jgi:hypothetical protein